MAHTPGAQPKDHETLDGSRGGLILAPGEGLTPRAWVMRSGGPAVPAWKFVGQTDLTWPGAGEGMSSMPVSDRD
jgi:hypothetical protein